MKITTAIVGTKHLGTEAIRALAGLQKGDTVMLLWDNQNQHDDNAVACFSAAGTMVGFIPRNCQHQVAIARALRAGEARRGERDARGHRRSGPHWRLGRRGAEDQRRVGGMTMEGAETGMSADRMWYRAALAVFTADVTLPVKQRLIAFGEVARAAYRSRGITETTSDARRSEPRMPAGEGHTGIEENGPRAPADPPWLDEAAAVALDALAGRKETRGRRHRKVCRRMARHHPRYPRLLRAPAARANPDDPLLPELRPAAHRRAARRLAKPAASLASMRRMRSYLASGRRADNGRCRD